MRNKFWFFIRLVEKFKVCYVSEMSNYSFVSGSAPSLKRYGVELYRKKHRRFNSFLLHLHEIWNIILFLSTKTEKIDSDSIKYRCFYNILFNVRVSQNIYFLSTWHQFTNWYIFFVFDLFDLLLRQKENENINKSLKRIKRILKV